ncbi:hypothetical protein K438DRAFT_1776210 [Mycena galopus ATCC 62051]|nr:hypothetical protein K438DRAFT_1776210 [Mycena galopus ATCC 62051]
MTSTFTSGPSSSSMWDAFSLYPFLPIDLERHIFEICARSRPALIPKLMLVAWRVKEWVEPLLYHTITFLEYAARAIDGYPIFTWRVLLCAIATKPTSFFARSVRNVCLLAHDGLEADLETLLSVCTGVKNLAIVPAIWRKLRERDRLVVPLTHLYTHLLDPLLCTLSASSFTCITRLGVEQWQFSRSPSYAEMCAHLDHMPQLTHLSSEEAAFIHVCDYILATHRRFA